MQVVPIPDVSGLRTTGRVASSVVRSSLPLSTSTSKNKVERIAIASILLHHYLAHEKSGITFVTNDQVQSGVQVDFATELADSKTASLQDVVNLLEDKKRPIEQDGKTKQGPIAAAALIQGTAQEGEGYLNNGQVRTRADVQGERSLSDRILCLENRHRS